MSIENVKAFMEKVKNDKELQDKLKCLVKHNMEASVAQGIQVAKKVGYEFTAEEFKEVMSSSGDAQLSDAELDNVAGGGGGEGPYTLAFVLGKGCI